MPDFDVDAFIDGYQGRTVSVTICGRTDLIAKHTEAEEALVAARTAAGETMHDRDVAKAVKNIEAIEKQMAAAQVVFMFRAVSHRVWQDLHAAHPPTKAQRTDMGAVVNPETFPLAAIAATAVSPEISVEQAERLRDTLSFGEFERLYQGVLAANSEVVGTPKSLLAAVIGSRPQNGESSTTAARKGSRGASS